MGFFQRSTKVAQQEATSVKEVGFSSSSPSTNNVATIRERMSRVATKDRPAPKPKPKPEPEPPKAPTKREKKKMRKEDKKELVKKKEERSTKIQALLAMRQANSPLSSY